MQVGVICASDKLVIARMAFDEVERKTKQSRRQFAILSPTCYSKKLSPLPTGERSRGG